MNTPTIIKTLAYRYAKRCWWMDVKDLIQEGWVAGLEAELTYDSTRGEKGAYVWFMVGLALRRYVWHMSVPVSVPYSKGNLGKGLIRCMIEEDMPDTVHLTGEEIMMLRESLCKIADAFRAFDPTGLAEQVILDRRTCSELAKETGTTYKMVAARVIYARNRMKKDVILQEMAGN